MRKIILIFTIIFSLKANLINDLFIKNYVTINQKEKISTILNELEDVTNYKYILINKNADFNVPLPKSSIRIYNLDTLEEYLIKNHSPYIFKVIKQNKNKIYLKIVNADELNDYMVKGVRLTKPIPIRDIIKKLNQEHYQQYIYKGENFKVPADPNIVIKSISELQTYLEATSYKNIIPVKTIDLNKDGIIDLVILKEVNNAIPQKITPLEATINHIKDAIQSAEKINNPNLIKSLLINNLKEIEEQLKGLKNGH